MKTQKLFFMVSLLVLGGIIKVSSQNLPNVVLNTTQASPGNNNVMVGASTNTAPNNVVGPSGNMVYSNVFLGSMAGANYQSTSAGDSARNVFIGTAAGAGDGSMGVTPVASGVDNVFIGTWAGRNSHTITKGGNNVCLGANTGYNIQGSNNTFLGRSAGGAGNPSTKVMSGDNNVFVGHNSGLSNSSGFGNIFLGQGSGDKNDTGSSNISIGSEGPVSGGSSNILIGKNSGWQATSNNNLMIGLNSGNRLTTGTGNSFFGYYSADNLTTGSKNLFLGSVQVLNVAASPTLFKAGFDTSNTVILADGDFNQRLYIHSNGYTGINLGNNNVPKNLLELNGGVYGTSGLRFRNYTSASTPVVSNGKVLTLNSNGDVVLTTDVVATGGNANLSAGDYVAIVGAGTPVSPYTISAQNIYTNDGKLAGDRTVDMDSHNMIFDTQSNGRIYIGDTSAPAFTNANFATATGNYRLYVEGGILTEKVKVAMRNTTDWADYVFAQDYKLMPLKEVESFINENNHLPGVASASDLVKNGLDVAVMQAKQMEKIEELTLYVIKQDKEIEELKAQVKALLEKK